MKTAIITLFAFLFLLPVANADSVATVTFSGVAADCHAFSVGPCSQTDPDAEVWSGTFSIDLSNAEILSDSITATGPGGGPWIGGEVGTFLSTDCLTALGSGDGCLITWSDAAG